MEPDLAATGSQQPLTPVLRIEARKTSQRVYHLPLPVARFTGREPDQRPTISVARA